MWDLYEGTLGPYWHPNRKLVEQKYVGAPSAPVTMQSHSPHVGAVECQSCHATRDARCPFPGIEPGPEHFEVVERREVIMGREMSIGSVVR